MQDSIIIIESPNKCEKIASYTGAKVYATKGHFKELDTDFIHWETYNPKFVYKKESKKHIDFLLSQCKNRDVYIATDPDREGYAIGYMFYEIIKNIAKSIKRVEFHEITKEGIQKGLQSSKDFATTNTNLYEAAKARIVGDKLVGFLMSPKIGAKFGTFKNNSVGRVQTPALALIVKRELEILAYEKQLKEERLSYKVIAKIELDSKEYTLHNENIFQTRQEAQSFLDSLVNIKEAFVQHIQSKEVKKAPPKPFQATTLIKEANKRYKFHSNTTMQLAQKLFEKGLITYHRTDSESLATSFLDEIQKAYAQESWYQKRIYTAGKHSQAEAHEAIRITHLTKDTNNLEDDEVKLLNLIYENTIYSQSKDSVYLQNTYQYNILGRIFSLSVSIPQYKSIFETTKSAENEENENAGLEIEKIPNLTKESKVIIKGYEIKEVQKAKPKRYKESDFIPLLQKEGIGRPSTYATFVSTLLKRKYIEIMQENKNEYLKATQKGLQVIDFLQKDNDTWITTSEFTKCMEQVLDKITECKATYLDFIKPLHAKMNNSVPQKLEKKPPTQAQIAFAQNLAKANHIELPQNIKESMKECCNFIEKYNKPSEKQINFAKNIADTLNINLPKDIATNNKICMEFIATHKDKYFTKRPKK
ncbi:type IA DNA topoisomerase [Helicobacter didelphidarum]|uniref:DNA topoisomerase n=1 Tax=Helicobacter didelphidarum TaxID=2040648 RepID=A0A3D8IMG5_9HELI|nr:type IA DNA topoisomerase [Helicobacter didelphidarum]RDU65771.1 type IA DNA topoisomerase [Helicobacter didelphidarum]